jgi:hypothetical protein
VCPAGLTGLLFVPCTPRAPHCTGVEALPRKCGAFNGKEPPCQAEKYQVPVKYLGRGGGRLHHPGPPMFQLLGLALPLPVLTLPFPCSFPMALSLPLLPLLLEAPFHLACFLFGGCRGLPCHDRLFSGVKVRRAMKTRLPGDDNGLFWCK